MIVLNDKYELVGFDKEFKENFNNFNELIDFAVNTQKTLKQKQNEVELNDKTMELEVETLPVPNLYFIANVKIRENDEEEFEFAFDINDLDEEEFEFVLDDE
jgi:hypothetical protein